MSRFTRKLTNIAAGLSVALCPLLAGAQGFPAKPIRIIVGFAAGNLVDVPLRSIVGPEMARILGQPIIVENRPGAAGMIAYEYVAKQAAPDGYTIVSATSSLPTLPLFVKDMNFDPIRDLPPVSVIFEFRSLLSSPVEAPWKNADEMIQYAKANPGVVNLGASSPAGPLALLTEALKQKHGLNIVSIIYKGTPELRQAILSNTIHLAWLGESTVEDVRVNRMKVIGVTGSQRLPALPDVPTFDEMDLPQIGALWFSLHVPGATPRAAIDRLYGALNAVLRDPKIREQLAKVGMTVINSSPDAAAKALANLAFASAAVAKKAGIKPQ